ncbi:hypothetical protein FISHEDRAFT_76416 [Fistulina hepatica ATCC 64428]|uniref:DNA damage-binding protein 1 n=1 Tax=Fistulina hepatica ATCC 64428 TaxID=1128425 RepID=A0A0D7A3F6_9AGAR|nr:hypothetical protein FISHEDRAFT_76416 [Fistulina hepatica ATCC 64428]
MKVIATFHPPSSVYASAKCRFAEDTDYLVVAKQNKLEVYSVQRHGLQHECSIDIYGRPLAVAAIPIPDTNLSNAVVLTDHPDLSLIFLRLERGKVVVDKLLDLRIPNQRPPEFLNTVCVHPTGTVSVVSCYTEKLKVIVLKDGRYSSDFDVSVREVHLLSMTFISSRMDYYTLALLHYHYGEEGGGIELVAHELNLPESEMDYDPSFSLTPTGLSRKQFPYPTEDIPIIAAIGPHTYEDDDDPSDRCGVLVLGGRRIVFYDFAGEEQEDVQRGKRKRLDVVSEAQKAKTKRERLSRRRKPRMGVEWPWGRVRAYCPLEIDSECPLPRVLVGDTHGRLAMLVVDTVKSTMTLLPLGTVSAPTTLTYLARQVVYVGSHTGDSLLVRVHSTLVSPEGALDIPVDVTTITPDALASAPEDNIDGTVVASTGSYVSELHVFKNIAPVLDAIVVDVDTRSQPEIVTCSGGSGTGALNVVRHGADFEMLAHAHGLPDFIGAWPLCDWFENSKHMHILVSTCEQTMLFKVADDTFACVDAEGCGFCTARTLAAANMRDPPQTAGKKNVYPNSAKAVQVTSRGVFLVEYEMGTGTYSPRGSWTSPPGPIVAACITPTQVVVACAGRSTGPYLVYLRLVGSSEDAVLEESINGPVGDAGDVEVSAICAMQPDATKDHARCFAVSFWGSQTIHIVAVNTDARGFQTIYKTGPLPSLARSLTFQCLSPADQGTSSFLFAGLTDGCLATYAWRRGDGKRESLEDPKMLTMGNTPLSLTQFTDASGRPTIFVSGDRPTIFSWAEGRLQNSPVMVQDIVAAASFETETFTSCLLLVRPAGLSIGRIRDLDKLHITTIPLGYDTPTSIVHDPTTRAFGVGAAHTTAVRVGDEEITSGKFTLYDDRTFSVLGHLDLEDREVVSSVQVLHYDIVGTPTSLFCLGVPNYSSMLVESSIQSRIVVASSSPTEPMENQDPETVTLSVRAVRKLVGEVKALAVIRDSLLAVAVDSAVKLFKIEVINPSTGELGLNQVADWNLTYMIDSLVSCGDYLLAADLFQSVVVLKVSSSANKSVISLVARDYKSLGLMSIGAASESDIVVGTSKDCLCSMKLTKVHGSSVVELTGRYHLGEMVTKIIPGQIIPSPDEVLKPKLIVFTVSGRISIIMNIAEEGDGGDDDDKEAIFMTSLERNMEHVLPGIGLAGHEGYRTQHSDVAARGFVDGDFVEQFLLYNDNDPIVKHIMSGRNQAEALGRSTESIRNILKTLQAVH